MCALQRKQPHVQKQARGEAGKVPAVWEKVLSGSMRRTISTRRHPEPPPMLDAACGKAPVAAAAPWKTVMLTDDPGGPRSIF